MDDLYNFLFTLLNHSNMKSVEHIQKIIHRSNEKRDTQQIVCMIANMNDETIINMLKFVDKLKCDEVTKEDIRIELFANELTSDTIYNIYNRYVGYLDILPIG